MRGRAHDEVDAYVSYEVLKAEAGLARGPVFHLESGSGIESEHERDDRVPAAQAAMLAVFFVNGLGIGAW